MTISPATDAPATDAPATDAPATDAPATDPPVTEAPVVGILGGGQLARMLCEAASPLGVHVKVLAARNDEGARGVAPEVVTGDPTDPVAVRRFASGVDVLTIDHENVDHACLAELEAGGVIVRPTVETMTYSDKAHQRRSFAAAGIPVPDFVVVDPATDPARASTAAGEFAERHPGGLVAKSSRGGYDGRAVWMLDAVDGGGFSSFLEEYRGAPLVLEQRLDLSCKLAVLVARRRSGEVSTWPVLQTVQVDGMCDEVIHPAPVSDGVAHAARELAVRIAEHTGALGVLAVELFVTTSGEVMVNEIAPRVHNSGHLTIEGSATSQFEQHLRAILDWPLGPTHMCTGAAVMANVVGVGQYEPRRRQGLALAEVPGAHVHLYGKTPRDRRKLGHVTVLGDDVDALRHDAATCAALLGGSGAR